MNNARGGGRSRAEQNRFFQNFVVFIGGTLCKKCVFKQFWGHQYGHFEKNCTVIRENAKISPVRPKIALLVPGLGSSKDPYACYRSNLFENAAFSGEIVLRPCLNELRSLCVIHYRNFRQLVARIWQLDIGTQGSAVRPGKCERSKGSWGQGGVVQVGVRQDLSRLSELPQSESVR